MFGLDLIFAAGVVMSGVTLYANDDYKAPAQRDGVQAVSLHREFYREDGRGKCEFKGVMVPFVRDWEEVRRTGEANDEMTLEAKPNATAGAAFLINQRVCEGKAPEVLLRGGDKYGLTEGRNFYEKHSVIATDLMTTPQEQQPKWLIQVLDRLERLASTDKAAATFLAVSQQEIAFVRGVVDGSIVPQAVVERTEARQPQAATPLFMN